MRVKNYIMLVGYTYVSISLCCDVFACIRDKVPFTPLQHFNKCVFRAGVGNLWLFGACLVAFVLFLSFKGYWSKLRLNKDKTKKLKQESTRLKIKTKVD